MVRKLFGYTALAILALCIGIGLTTHHSYVTTPSMYPTIPPGSMIFINETKDVHVGQVIVFRANGLTWAHRLIQIKPDGTYITKGDNPANAPDVFDPPVTENDVVGVVSHAPRWLGFPELIVHDPGYGLAWLRAELGIGGRAFLCLVAGVVACALAAGKRRPTVKPRRGRHATAAEPEIRAESLEAEPDTTPFPRISRGAAPTAPSTSAAGDSPFAPRNAADIVRFASEDSDVRAVAAGAGAGPGATDQI